MKKLLSLVLALCLILSLAACGKDGADSSSKPNSSADQTAFTAPKNYATVLLVTINPQFKLYLDAEGKVLAVEAVNDDAKSIKDSISFENESYESVVEKIVIAAKDNGFVNESVDVKITIVEVKEEVAAEGDAEEKVENKIEDTDEIKKKIEEQVKDTAEQLHISVNITVTEEIEDVSSKIDQSSAESTSSEVSSSKVSSSETSSKVESKPTHTHKFSAATCTSPKKCSCGATEGKALGHNYKDGVCTRCKAKDPNYEPTSVTKKSGKWIARYFYDNSLYVVTIIMNDPGRNGISVAIGQPVSTLPEDMQNNPELKNDCDTFDGVDYYFGMGDGIDLSPSEDGNKIILSNESNDKLVLERTGENTVKFIQSSSSTFDFIKLSDGTVFTFTKN